MRLQLSEERIGCQEVYTASMESTFANPGFEVGKKGGSINVR